MLATEVPFLFKTVNIQFDFFYFEGLKVGI